MKRGIYRGSMVLPLAILARRTALIIKSISRFYLPR
jgi:hypothetical protein